MSRIILSIVLILAGYLIVWKADWFLVNFGGIPSAEKFFRTEGGSRLFYKFIGVMFILFGSLHLTGLLNPFLSWVVVRIFGFGR